MDTSPSAQPSIDPITGDIVGGGSGGQGGSVSPSGGADQQPPSNIGTAVVAVKSPETGQLTFYEGAGQGFSDITAQMTGQQQLQPTALPQGYSLGKDSQAAATIAEQNALAMQEAARQAQGDLDKQLALAQGRQLTQIEQQEINRAARESEKEAKLAAQQAIDVARSQLGRTPTQAEIATIVQGQMSTIVAQPKIEEKAVSVTEKPKTIPDKVDTSLIGKTPDFLIKEGYVNESGVITSKGLSAGLRGDENNQIFYTTATFYPGFTGYKEKGGEKGMYVASLNKEAKDALRPDGYDYNNPDIREAIKGYNKLLSDVQKGKQGYKFDELQLFNQQYPWLTTLDQDYVFNRDALGRHTNFPLGLFVRMEALYDNGATNLGFISPKSGQTVSPLQYAMEIKDINTYTTGVSDGKVITVPRDERYAELQRLKDWIAGEGNYIPNNVQNDVKDYYVSKLAESAKSSADSRIEYDSILRGIEKGFDKYVEIDGKPYRESEVKDGKFVGKQWSLLDSIKGLTTEKPKKESSVLDSLYWYEAEKPTKISIRPQYKLPSNAKSLADDLVKLIASIDISAPKFAKAGADFPDKWATVPKLITVSEAEGEKQFYAYEFEQNLGATPRKFGLVFDDNNNVIRYSIDGVVYKTPYDLAKGEMIQCTNDECVKENGILLTAKTIIDGLTKLNNGKLPSAEELNQKATVVINPQEKPKETIIDKNNRNDTPIYSVGNINIVKQSDRGGQGYYGTLAKNHINYSDVARLINSYDKVIVLYSNLDWCPPCIAEFGEISQLQDKYKTQDVAILYMQGGGESEKFLNSYIPGKIDSLNAVPVNIVFNQGKFVDSKVGRLTTDELTNVLKDSKPINTEPTPSVEKIKTPKKPEIVTIAEQPKAFKVSDVKVNDTVLRDNKITVTWKTDVPTTSQIMYCDSSGQCSSTIADKQLVTEHKVELDVSRIPNKEDINISGVNSKDKDLNEVIVIPEQIDKGTFKGFPKEGIARLPEQPIAVVTVEAGKQVGTAETGTPSIPQPTFTGARIVGQKIEEPAMTKIEPDTSSAFVSLLNQTSPALLAARELNKPTEVVKTEEKATLPDNIARYIANELQKGKTLDTVVGELNKTTWADEVAKANVTNNNSSKLQNAIDFIKASKTIAPAIEGTFNADVRDNQIKIVLKNNGLTDNEINNSFAMSKVQEKPTELPKVTTGIQVVDDIAKGGIDGLYSLALGIPILAGTVATIPQKSVRSPELGKMKADIPKLSSELVAIPAGIAAMVTTSVFESAKNPAYGIPKALVLFGSIEAVKGLPSGIKQTKLNIEQVTGKVVAPRALNFSTDIPIIKVPEGFERLKSEADIIARDKAKTETILSNPDGKAQRAQFREMLNPETRKVFDSTVDLIETLDGRPVPKEQIRTEVDLGAVARMPQEAAPIVKSVFQKYANDIEIRGSLADWQQMKGVKDAYRPNDIDLFVKGSSKVSPSDIALDVVNETNRKLGQNILRIDPANNHSVQALNRNGEWVKLLDAHNVSEYRLSAPLGFTSIKQPVVIDGLQFEALGNQLWHRGLEVIRPGVGSSRGLMGAEAAGRAWRQKDVARFQIIVSNMIDNLAKEGKVDLAKKMQNNLDSFMNDPRGEPLKLSKEEVGRYEEEFRELFNEMQEASLYSDIDVAIAHADGTLTRYQSPSMRQMPGTLYHVARDITPFEEAVKKNGKVVSGKILDESGKLIDASREELYFSPEAALDRAYELQEGNLGKNPGVIALRTSAEDIASTIQPVIRVESVVEPKLFELDVFGKKFTPKGYQNVRVVLDEWTVNKGKGLYPIKGKGGEIGRTETYDSRTLKKVPMLWFNTEIARANPLLNKIPSRSDIAAINIMAMKASIGDFAHPRLPKAIKVSGKTTDMGNASLIEFRRDSIKWKKNPKQVEEQLRKESDSITKEAESRLDKQKIEKTNENLDKAIDEVAEERLSEIGNKTKKSSIGDLLRSEKGELNTDAIRREFVLNLGKIKESLLLNGIRFDPSTYRQTAPISKPTVVAEQKTTTIPTTVGVKPTTELPTVPLTTPKENTPSVSIVQPSVTVPPTQIVPPTIPIIPRVPIPSKTPSMPTTPKVATTPIPPPTTVPPIVPPIPSKTPPPKPILTPAQAKIKGLTQKQKDTALAWRQGAVYRAWVAPYDKKNMIVTHDPIPDVKYETGIGSAYRSLVAKGVGIPQHLRYSMGIQVIDFRRTGDPTKPSMDFTENYNKYGGKQKRVSVGRVNGVKKATRQRNEGLIVF